MGQTDDGTSNQTQDAPQENRAPRADATEAKAGEAESGLVRLMVDFARQGQRADGTEWIPVGAVTSPELAALDLHEGQRAVFEEPGELQMTGVLRRKTGAGTVGEFWIGELDPASMIYHIRVEPQTLYYAGPEGCWHFGESILEPLPTSGPEHNSALTPSPLEDTFGARQRSEDAPRASHAAPQPTSEDLQLRSPEDMPEDTPVDTAAGALAATTSAPTAHGQPTPRMTVGGIRLRTTPWRLLTLGVEGTWEQWHRALTTETVRGEATFAEGEHVVLIDDAREVDARVHVLRLPPDTQYSAGRRIWLAEPTWETVRPAWSHV